MTQSIQKLIAVSNYRREKQLAYNEEHNITPRSVTRAVEESLSSRVWGDKAVSVINDAGGNFDVTETLRELEADMLKAAENLEFEKAALLRDQIRELKRSTGDAQASGESQRSSYGRQRKRRPARAKP
jgi:excinuclease ABC subunit B